ncbi:hypothetical protein [Paenibacillus aceris]|uniref:Peptidoglycan hydrolase CwlO-like protein n=1 Tax=Paenibacillus aceris TaxID=869555 RepID=A0ABS4I275_9BACL|nr:hypothetical protein [Paenibacillus aceris]MBP1964820.1 peptidoglycan hydrolase CwlO-like protein [Paenibacillus aceris]NHW33797.1 hypothetical protein [Paenibacillus aceris]
MKNFISLLAAFVLLSVISVEAAAAAPIEITAALLEKTMASATQTQANRIHSLQDELLTLQKQEQDWDTTIALQHNQNKEAQAALSQQAKEIDKPQLAKLEEDVLQTRERYKPLLSRYTALNKQIETVRPLKNKSLNTLLRLQAAALKIPVQLARADIQAKEKVRQAAKEQSSKAAKKVRSLLDDLDPVNAQIKAKQSAVKSSRKSLSPLWSGFKKSAKQGDAIGVQSTLSSMVSLLRQINEEKQRIFKLETNVRDKLAAIKKDT